MPLIESDCPIDLRYIDLSTLEGGQFEVWSDKNHYRGSIDTIVVESPEDESRLAITSEWVVKEDFSSTGGWKRSIVPGFRGALVMFATVDQRDDGTILIEAPVVNQRVILYPPGVSGFVPGLA